MSAVTELKTRTPAETQLLQLAEARGENENARRPAIEALRRDGLPTRKVEAWHYTDLRALMGRRIKDDTDLRNIFIERTPAGMAYLRTFSGLVLAAASGKDDSQLAPKRSGKTNAAA